MAREEKGYTQEYMAQKLGYKSKSHYCMIEGGSRGISVETAIAIAQLLDKPIVELFCVDEVHEMQSTGTEGREGLTCPTSA